jgi:hypothetical protein
MNVIKKTTIAMHVLLGTPVVAIGPHGVGIQSTINNALKESNIPWLDMEIPNPYDYDGYYNTDETDVFISKLRQAHLYCDKDRAFIINRLQKISATIAVNLSELMLFSGRRFILIGTYIPDECKIITERCEKVYF